MLDKGDAESDHVVTRRLSKMDGAQAPDEPSWAERFFPKGIHPRHEKSMTAIRHSFAALATLLQAELPQNEYRRQVLSKLEVAAMLATKSFSHG
jgi:hypothetical protein